MLKTYEEIYNIEMLATADVSCIADTFYLRKNNARSIILDS